jgi:hypothetical protein
MNRAEQRRAWREANKERTAAYNKKWRAENAEKCKEYSRQRALSGKGAASSKASYHRHRDSIRARVNARAYGYVLMRKYGLSREQYEALLLAQDGRCAICSSTRSAKRRLAVDHDHETGAVRALLCVPCNAGLGGFGDRADLLEKAALYLRLHRGKAAA